ncbi:hypothetical protein PFICI_04022 [Pestalotiopsis fici W106-1]|uniref:Uncharacterized protein n=1 Tax=Pestalotiopsis fici (strain W106-1 / CGMCC3.15140) TaxID=1229662 RepID=W3XKK4_PESFW|nr:uncharacterized protein PFICI_04022 [Pestalotiopsis fici W106-1]ETS85997.1 hypothetical protein PFICI_04022 [Pestalotiopsis fici W106-1]
MASSSHIKEFPRETDPELLAALAKLADGCDELRRWIKGSSARAIADANRHGQTNIIKRVNTFSDDEYQQVLGLTGSPDHLEPNDSDVADAADRISSKTRSLTGPAPVMPPPTLKPETHSVHRSDFDIQRSQASPYSGSINVRTRDPNDILVEYPLTEEEIRKSKENLLKRFDSDLFVITLMELLDPDLDALSQDYFVERHGQEIEHIKKDIEMSWPEEFPARDESLHYIYDSTRRFNTIRVWYFGGTKESFLHPHDMTYLFQAFSSSPAYSTDVDVDNAMLFMKDLSRFCPAFRMISGSSSPLRLSVRACECFALGQWDSPFSSSLPAISPLCAIKFERQKGRILNKNTGNGIDLREWCSVTYFDTRGTVILWSDDFMPLIANDQEIKPCGWHGEGFTVLLRIVVEVYKEWNSIWGKTLEKIDGLVSVKPADTLDRKYWQTLMFDSGFEISETYFTILQMLRIFDDWIEETESDFTKLNDNIVSRAQSMVIYEDADVDLTILTTNLNVVMGRLQSSAKSLRDRIKRKKEEVQSLRDGVSL